MNEDQFQYHYDKGLHTISQLELVKHIHTYEKEFFHHFQKGDNIGAEKALTDLMNVLTKFPKEDELNALRIYLISLISEIARIKMKHGELTPYLLSNVTALITIMEGWTHVSEYFTAVPWLINMLASRIRDGGFIPFNRNKHIVKVIQIIGRKLTEPLSVSSLAAHVDLHPSYLSRIFKQEMDMSIVKFINRKRAIKAAVDLKYSSLSLKEIAHKYQFYNQSYFTKVFKETHHVTPKHYRNNAFRYNSPAESVL